MSMADTQYKRVIKNIFREGVLDTDQKVRTVWESDGTPAHAISWFGQSMYFDNSEVTILTTKKVAWKTAIKELLWIWQMKSNVVEDLRKMGVKIWNQWELPDGTIGKAYGYQLGKKNQLINGLYVDQVDHLIHNLKENPVSRRHITNLWNPDDLIDMSLTPCVYETQWHVKKGKLHLEVRARSNDMALGNPFNVFQYNVLQRMVAQVTGLELGNYLYHIGDAHVYTKHIGGVSLQLDRPTHEAPKLVINPEIKSFYDFTIDDFELKGYEHGEPISFEVAI